MAQICGLDQERAFVQRHVLLHPVLTQSAGIRIGLLTAAPRASARRHHLLFPPALSSREQGERPWHPATYRQLIRTQPDSIVTIGTTVLLDPRQISSFSMRIGSSRTRMPVA
jgi:hypothetical protein